LSVKKLQSAVGCRIRKLRRRKGFSQEGFADHCGLHRTYMGGIERGEHNLTVQTLLTVAEGLDITLSKLLSGIERELDSQEKARGGHASGHTASKTASESPSEALLKS
jgi:transcriptional regulator with XRE-family HTH domain